MLTEIRNRGVNNACIVCTDGLSGFADAIETVWPEVTVQTCVVHLIRNSVKFCGYQHRKAVTRALRPIYTAPTLESAVEALNTFEIEWGIRYPAIVDL